MVKLVLIAKFIYNHAKNASSSFIFFELNCSYYQNTLYNKNINLNLKSKITNKLIAKL